jgi:hypothetical protein
MIPGSGELFVFIDAAERTIVVALSTSRLAT